MLICVACTCVAGVCWLRYGTLEAISKKQHFIVPAQTQQTHVQTLSPENKGVSPYVPLQAGYRSKKQGLVHRWLYIILVATLSQCYVTFLSLVLHDLPHVQISQVLSLCYAVPTSLLLSQDSGLDCFLLILLPATFDPLMVKEHHLYLGFVFL
jgi:hypothetical protein